MKNRTIDQFRKRAKTYTASANWITDPELISAHLAALEEARRGKPPGHLLELCCGTGVVGRNMAVAGWSVCGIDLTREMAEEASRFFPCICAPAEENPYLDGSFDAVFLRQAYFLLEDGQKALAQGRRVLREDGVFILSQTVPFSEKDAPHLEAIHREKQLQLRSFHTEGTLRDELTRAGFAVEGVRRLSVRENVSRWMAEAPELDQGRKEKVLALIEDSPDAYRLSHRVERVGSELFEDWNWVILTARKTP